MTNDPLLEKLNALLDEKEAEALGQEIDVNLAITDDRRSEPNSDSSQDKLEVFDENKTYQRENPKESIIRKAKDITSEKDRSIFDESADAIVAADDFPKTTDADGSSLKYNIGLTLLSFILGGIFFQVFLTAENKERMTSILPNSFVKPNSSEASERISILENYMQDIVLETNSLKAISAELSAAVSDLTDLNERLHGSFIDLRGRLDVLEENYLIKNTANNIKIGSDQLYGENNSWFVNFGTYNDIRLARVWADRIENEGFSVAIETKSDSSPKQYRVRIIELVSSKEATDVASKLTSRYKLPPLWIDEY